MIDKILVVIHLPYLMEKVLEIGLDFADKYSADTILLMAIPKTRASTVVYTSAHHHMPLSLIANSVNFKSEYKKLLSSALNKAKEAKPHLNISTKLVDGRLADKIIEIAKKCQC